MPRDPRVDPRPGDVEYVLPISTSDFDVCPFCGLEIYFFAFDYHLRQHREEPVHATD